MPEAKQETSIHDMTVAELQNYAEDRQIDLGTATKKADIVKAIVTVEDGIHDPGPGAPDAHDTSLHDSQGRWVGPAGEITDDTPDPAAHDSRGRWIGYPVFEKE